MITTMELDYTETLRLVDIAEQIVQLGIYDYAEAVKHIPDLEQIIKQYDLVPEILTKPTTNCLVIGYAGTQDYTITFDMTDCDNKYVFVWRSPYITEHEPKQVIAFKYNQPLTRKNCKLHLRFTERKQAYRYLNRQLGHVRNAVEIGVFEADNLIELKQYLKPVNLVGVDRYVTYPDQPKDKPMNLVLETAQHRANDIGATLVVDDSTNYANTVPDSSLDFVYIDGDHSYEACKHDITVWWPKIKPGGILSGHDFAASGNVDYGVIQATTEFAEAHDLTLHVIAGPFATWWVFKPL